MVDYRIRDYVIILKSSGDEELNSSMGIEIYFADERNAGQLEAHIIKRDIAGIYLLVGETEQVYVPLDEYDYISVSHDETHAISIRVPGAKGSWILGQIADALRLDEDAKTKQQRGYKKKVPKAKVKEME
jgi:hypothetical protein